MTVEEAIEHLKGLYVEFDYTLQDDEILQAIDMAIKALENLDENYVGAEMCRYCDSDIMSEFPERHSSDNDFTGRVYDTCICEHEDGWYMEFPNIVDIPIRYCPFCGRELKGFWSEE